VTPQLLAVTTAEPGTLTGKLVTDFGTLPLTPKQGGFVKPTFIPGVRYVSNVTATGVAGATSHYDVPLSIPLTAAALAPLDGFSALAPGTTFAWRRSLQVAHQVVIAPSGGAVGPTLRLYSDGESVALPDLTSMGLTLSPKTTYRWYVFATDDMATVDAALGLHSSFNGFSAFTRTVDRSASTP
jgi:hypothetical protein